jgi:hypothetical protein
MKTLLTGIFAGAVLCGAALAQDATPSQTNGSVPQGQPNPATTQSEPSSSGQASGSIRIAPGSVIPVRLTKTIDAKKAKTGDEIEATVTQDLKAQNGEIVVPKDTKVLGHVTEAQVRTKDQTESEVGIAFDHAVIKDRAEVSLPMSIQAIVAPPNSNSNNDAGGNGVGEPANTPSPGVMPSNGNGRSGMAGTPSQLPTGPELSGSAQTGANAHQPITGTTQGVVGISNLNLAQAPDSTEGSVISSEKNNVKLESGTFMLLRVNQ